MVRVKVAQKFVGHGRSGEFNANLVARPHRPESPRIPPNPAKDINYKGMYTFLYTLFF